MNDSPKKKEKKTLDKVYLYFKSVNSTRSSVQTRRFIYIYVYVRRKGEINWTNYPSYAIYLLGYDIFRVEERVMEAVSAIVTG